MGKKQSEDVIPHKSLVLHLAQSWYSRNIYWRKWVSKGGLRVCQEVNYLAQLEIRGQHWMSGHNLLKETWEGKWDIHSWWLKNGNQCSCLILRRDDSDGRTWDKTERQAQGRQRQFQLFPPWQACWHFVLCWGQTTSSRIRASWDGACCKNRRSSAAAGFVKRRPKCRGQPWWHQVCLHQDLGENADGKVCEVKL